MLSFVQTVSHLGILLPSDDRCPCISGVTFVSVPGMVMLSDMTYMQTCLGFVLGYFAVAYLLLPVYYRLKFDNYLLLSTNTFRQLLL